MDWHRENGNFHVINNGFPQKMPKYYKEKIFTETERKLHAEKAIQKSDENYWEIFNELENLQIQDPDSYMYQNSIMRAQKIKDKINDKNTF